MTNTYRIGRVHKASSNNHYSENSRNVRAEREPEVKEKKSRSKENICKTYSDFDQLPAVLGYKEVASILGTSRQTTYNYMNSPDFPAIKFSDRVIRVMKEDFIKWIENKKKETDINKGI